MTGSESRDITANRWSIRWKLMVIMAILIVGLVALLSYNQISSQRKILEDELNRIIGINNGDVA